jgi:hypothetical protein
MCGQRRAAFEHFEQAPQHYPSATAFLLVDSETAVRGQPLAHLQQCDGWNPTDVDEVRCHLMVQVMESWFLADPDALPEYYGKHFQSSALPATQDLESVAKSQVYESLDRATRNTQKGAYQKIRHGAALLETIDSGKVRARAPHCDRFFKALEAALSAGG